MTSITKLEWKIIWDNFLRNRAKLSQRTGAKIKMESNISLKQQRTGEYLPELWRCDEIHMRWIPIPMQRK
jgi:hypothetical protein